LAMTGAASAVQRRQRQQQQRQQQPGELSEQQARPETPVHQRAARSQQMPGTPATPQPSYLLELNTCTPQARGTQSPEVETYCPQPYRALPLSTQNLTLPSSPSWSSELYDSDLIGLTGEHGPGVRRQQSGNVLECGGGKHADGSRPLSSASTSVGPTPSPIQAQSASPLTASSPTPTPMAAAAAAQAAQGKKVFVGGIPQEMGQTEFFHFFNNLAAVKKAWLQKYRPAPGSSRPVHNHRGFGFVIFQDDTAVDRLLGSTGFSRFFPLPEAGRQLEVKRAVGCGDAPPPSGTGRQARTNGPPHSDQRRQSPLPPAQPHFGHCAAGGCAAVLPPFAATSPPMGCPAASTGMLLPAPWPTSCGAGGVGGAMLQRAPMQGYHPMMQHAWPGPVPMSISPPPMMVPLGHSPSPPPMMVGGLTADCRVPGMHFQAGAPPQWLAAQQQGHMGIAGWTHQGAGMTANPMPEVMAPGHFVVQQPPPHHLQHPQPYTEALLRQAMPQYYED